MKRFITAAASGLALMAASPATAQTVESQPLTEDDAAAIADMFGDLFGEAKDLTPEEQERLPEAMVVVSKLFPEGTYARMMEESIKPMIGSMSSNISLQPAVLVAAQTGLDRYELGELDEADLTAALELLDPDRTNRDSAMAELTLELVMDLFTEIEPAYRDGLARAYAIRFSEAELTDLASFFDTPVGAKYAAESFLIPADPQVMAAMNELLPSVFTRLPEMMEQATAIEAEFASPRTYSELSADEQAQLAELLGRTADELAESEPMTRSTAVTTPDE